MTAAALRTLIVPITGLLTIADWLALGETDQDFELMEGHLVVSPKPTFSHMRASFQLGVALEAMKPSGMVVAPEVDVDLQLTGDTQPATIRAPDLVVATSAEVARVRAGGGILRASGVVLVVEVVSPGSRRTDRLVKRREYADAGIAHYWIVELDPQVSLTACRLVDGDYLDDGPLTGTVTIPEPFGVRLDLDALVAE